MSVFPEFGSSFLSFMVVLRFYDAIVCSIVSGSISADLLTDWRDAAADDNDDAVVLI